MEEILEMTKKELERIKVLSQVREKKITQVTAAKILKISDRQVRYLLAEIKIYGDKGIISKKRGRLRNHCIPKNVKKDALKLVKEHYQDFSPKLANEFLKSQHKIHISNETLRKWMIEIHLWVPNTQQKNIHRPRERRGRFGELIQIDGSHHDWFEGRSPRCVLMVAIDDATSLLTSLYFAPAETLEAYLKTLQYHLQTYGIPQAFYGDHCSVNIPRVLSLGNESTQFKKILNELGCELILANSPQAKGRVERVNRTLQDRLVKEMRLRGISSIAAANEFLEEYMEKHNALFAKKPGERGNVHRSIEGLCLEQVLCVRETRTLSKDFTIQLDNTFYKIEPQEGNLSFYKGAEIEIRTMLDGNKIALFKKTIVSMHVLKDIENQILDSKQIEEWKIKKQYTPPPNHPYKKGSYNRMLKEKHQVKRYGT
jgi:hypothetical protein